VLEENKDYLMYPFDAKLILRKKRSIKEQLLKKNKKLIVKKIAVLGGSTTSEIIDILELFLINSGIKPEFYESEYGQYWCDVVFQNDKLMRFKPNIVYIHTSIRNITQFPSIDDDNDRIDQLVQVQYLHFKKMWDMIHDMFGCVVIQNNFEMPYYRLLGNSDGSDIHGKLHFINQLNELFNVYYQQNTYFYINDINYLAATFGLEKWSDPCYWYMYKYSLSSEAIPYLTYNLVNIIRSIYGKTKKALILDLDNTIWGGVIGDDGVNGIQIGQDNPIGQAYSEFQTYLKELSKLGVLLNICSKNEYEIAKLGLDCSDSVLKLSDFICSKINWENKMENVKNIIKELNIASDSIVFIDDNPAEREIVKKNYERIETPPINKVEKYINIIDKSGYFEFRNITADDRKRTKMYRLNIERNELKKRFGDYDEYLESLEMKAELGKFHKQYITRIAQLVNKTNQFNLTTKRFTESEINQFAYQEDKICVYGKLRDKFGDNGLVTAIVGSIKKDTIHVLLWIMSCRVFKRNMEFIMFDYFVKQAKSKQIRFITGNYIKTDRNKIVKNLYKDCGFKNVREEDNGDSTWILDIESYKVHNEKIEVVEYVE
jgi:FkbH-like protein